ncbi:hypothetical protein [Caulobacter sp. 1776]|uniref:hypothetical protein n=1 Tax=Caulobacter sp. 1776 TaxID=3156420 RepID=UPI0033997833
MRLFVSVALLSLALATSVSAQAMSAANTEQPAAAPTEVAPLAVDKKKDAVVCRKEIPTGSQFPVKVCTTAEQRKAQRGAAQRAQETMQSGSPVTPN